MMGHAEKSLAASAGPQRHRRAARHGEKLIELAMAAIAASVVVAIILVFAFLAREALPLLVTAHPLEALRGLTLPTGEDGGFAWQPVGRTPKLNVLPLVVGSLKITTIALALGVPTALAAALFVSEVVSARTRRILKPAIELLAGIPSVVLGLLMLRLVAPAMQRALDLTYTANAIVAGLALSLAVAPIVFSVAEEALSAVPRETREACYALGAHKWQTALFVVLPAALPGILAAVTLGFGRAIGETMIVLMTSGNAGVVDVLPTSGARTVTATIAAELGETERGGEHWRVLFLLGLVLVTTTIMLDAAGRAVARYLARRQGGIQRT
jgi:phosphate transport system permease protein